MRPDVADVELGEGGGGNEGQEAHKLHEGHELHHSIEEDSDEEHVEERVHVEEAPEEDDHPRRARFEHGGLVSLQPVFSGIALGIGMRIFEQASV